LDFSDGESKVVMVSLGIGHEVFVYVGLGGIIAVPDPIYQSLAWFCVASFAWNQVSAPTSASFYTI
jgi:hypothetical protein